MKTIAVLLIITFTNQLIDCNQLLIEVNSSRSHLTQKMRDQYPNACATLNKYLDDAEDFAKQAEKADLTNPKILEKIRLLRPAFNLKISATNKAIDWLQQARPEAQRFETIVQRAKTTQVKLQRLDDEYKKLPNNGVIIQQLKNDAQKAIATLQQPLRILPQQAFTVPTGLNFAEGQLNDFDDIIKNLQQALNESKAIIIDLR